MNCRRGESWASRRSSWLFLSAVGLALQACCQLSPHHLESDANRPVSPQSLGGVEERFAPPLGRVIRFGPAESQRPVVLLFHEITGPTKETLRLGRRLEAAGFTVYVPVLFGEPGHRLNGTWSIIRRCLGRDYRCWLPGSSRIAGKAKELLNALTRRHPQSRFGAIGMCLTGSLPLELVEHPQVHAAILSQPALPAFGSGPGVSREALARAARAIEQRSLRLLALRFSADCLSPAGRMEAIAAGLPPHTLKVETYPSATSLHHSVLTDSLSETHDRAFEDVVAYLTDRLLPTSPTGGSQ